MELSEAEIKFAHYGRDLMVGVHKALIELAEQSGIFPRETGEQLEGGKSWRDYAISFHGKVETVYARFGASQDAVGESINVTMGHDENWNALVIVASSKTDPRTIALSGDAEKDSQVIEAEARRCFELIRKA